MSKRKYLFDRVGSYKVSGIPCGNPRRVGSGEVLCMPSGSGGLGPCRGAPQTEDLETEGERHLRAMAQKQLKTDLTLDQLLSQRREFAQAGKYKPLAEEVRGALQLPDYEEVVEGDRRLEALRHYGLTEDEVRLQLAQEGVQLARHLPASRKAGYGTEPQVARDRLAAIESRMRAKDIRLAAPDTFRDQKLLSRQELDLERSLFQGTSRDSRRALPRLLTSRAGGRDAAVDDPADPAHHLRELMAAVEERAKESLREKRRRRRKERRRGEKKLEEDQDEGDSAGEVAGCMTLEEALVLKEAERSAGTVVETTAETDPKAAAAESGITQPVEIAADIAQPVEKAADIAQPVEKAADIAQPVEKAADIAQPVEKAADIAQPVEKAADIAQPVEKAADIAQPVEKAADKDKDSSRTVLKGHIEFFPVEYIESNRMTVDEIKQNPKFENYDPGQPNNVLYLKNLSPRVRERDLVSMFGRFQKDCGPETVFRLMTGRMRGQAFVTFHSPEVASQALQLVNGFLLHGQPVIVQYGKRS